jgi:hypothetical protein
LETDLKLVSVFEIPIALTAPGKVVLILYKHRNVSLFIFSSFPGCVLLPLPLKVLHFLTGILPAKLTTEICFQAVAL